MLSKYCFPLFCHCHGAFKGAQILQLYHCQFYTDLPTRNLTARSHLLLTAILYYEATHASHQSICFFPHSLIRWLIHLCPYVFIHLFSCSFWVVLFVCPITHSPLNYFFVSFLLFCFQSFIESAISFLSQNIQLSQYLSPYPWGD